MLIEVVCCLAFPGQPFDRLYVFFGGQNHVYKSSEVTYTKQYRLTNHVPINPSTHQTTTNNKSSRAIESDIMSTQTTLRLPLNIPTTLQGTNDFSIQLSVHNTEQDMDAYVEECIQPSDLTAGNVLTLQRASLPRFRSGSRELRVNYWKGGKFVGTENLGVV
jgi:hypothetical protein